MQNVTYIGICFEESIRSKIGIQKRLKFLFIKHRIFDWTGKFRIKVVYIKCLNNIYSTFLTFLNNFDYLVDASRNELSKQL